MRRRLLAFGFVLGISLLSGCGKKPQSESGAPGSAPARLRIAVIPKGTTHEFWKSVHAGAVKAARELDVDVVWKGPLKEDDLKSQIELVQSFTAQKVSGIVLAPLNDKALIASVDAAVAAQIPVVIFDSALAGGKISSFVATDNRAAGRLAGERLVKLLGGKGKVAVLRYQEGSASTRDREEGFLEAVSKAPELQVVSDNQYAGATTETAASASESLLLAKNAAKGGLDGVFTPNESTSFGMLRALENTKLEGKLRFVGFDASEKLIEGVRRGAIDGLVLQDPFNMGYLAVKTITLALRKQPVEARTDTGAQLLDKQNLEEPAMKELIRPDLAKWLGR